MADPTDAPEYYPGHKAEARKHPFYGWYVKVDGEKIIEVVQGVTYWRRKKDLEAVLHSRGLRIDNDGWIVYRRKH